MCGIIAAFSNHPKKPVNELIINRYQDQRSRGQEGFGLIRLGPAQAAVDRATEPVKFLLDLHLKKAARIIAHHRLPTSTQNLLSQTHPMLVQNPKLKHDYLVVHNGVIYNAEEIKTLHEQSGFTYRTQITRDVTHQNFYYRRAEFNDSEAMAVELALFIEGQIPEIRSRGGQAFIAAQLTKKGRPLKVFFGRHSNPLVLQRSKGLLQLASEGPGEEITEDRLFAFSLQDPKMSLSQKTLVFAPEKPAEPEKPATAKTAEPAQAESKPTGQLSPLPSNAFREEYRGKTADEIEELAEEELDRLEVEIMETVSDMRLQLDTRLLDKIGPYKGEVCRLLDQMRQVVIARQAETALAPKALPAAPRGLWRGDWWDDEPETRGQEKLSHLGF